MIWSEHRKPCDECRYDHVVHESKQLGKVFITWKSWKDINGFDVQGDALSAFNIYVCEGSLEDAKLKIEEEFRAIAKNLLSCLTEGEG